jgi:FlaA1/EpsC-like NDP-sugar epimerase
MIGLAGFTVRDASNPDCDIEIVVTGKRSGEKLHEELFKMQTVYTTRAPPKILHATPRGAALDVAKPMTDLKAALDSCDVQSMRHSLVELAEKSGQRPQTPQQKCK